MVGEKAGMTRVKTIAEKRRGCVSIPFYYSSKDGFSPKSWYIGIDWHYQLTNHDTIFKFDPVFVFALLKRREAGSKSSGFLRNAKEIK